MIHLDLPLIRERYLAGESSTELAQSLGCSSQTIRRHLVKNGIPIRTYSQAGHVKRRNNFLWSRAQIELIEGELLGDGNLHISKNRPASDARFNLRSVFREHCTHVISQLPDSLFSMNQPWKHKPTRKGRHFTYSIASKTDPQLTLLYHRWYLGGKKTIPSDLRLTPEICYYWYVGDGGLRRSHYKPGKRFPACSLSTQGFTRRELETIILPQFNNLGFFPVVAKSGKTKVVGGGFALRFNKDSSERFLKWISPSFAIGAFSYKFDPTLEKDYDNL